MRIILENQKQERILVPANIMIYDAIQKVIAVALPDNILVCCKEDYCIVVVISGVQ